MASGSRRAVSGSFVSTGALQKIETLQFTPKKVELFNTTTKGKGTWLEAMGDGALFKDLDTGTGTEDMSFVTANGVTALPNDGFSCGTDGFFNSGDVIYYHAEE